MLFRTTMSNLIKNLSVRMKIKVKELQILEFVVKTYRLYSFIIKKTFGRQWWCIKKELTGVRCFEPELQGVHRQMLCCWYSDYCPSAPAAEGS